MLKGSRATIMSSDSDERSLKVNSSSDKRYESFFNLLQTGNASAVTEFLNSQPADFDVNYVDAKGHSALKYAFGKADINLVEALLSRPNISIGKSLVYAVLSDKAIIVEKVLSTEAKYKSRSTKEVRAVSDERADEISVADTPLVIAAQRGSSEIIKLLLNYGHTIERPHPAKCFCRERCSGRGKGELLSESRDRVNLYQALCNPAYITQTSDDPILESFLLNDELNQWSIIEPEFKKDYDDMAENCSRFGVDLLDKCRTSAEVRQVLSRRKCPNPSQYRGEFFPRLSLAVDYGFKNFVAHPNAQLVLGAEWLHDWQEYRAFGLLSEIASFAFRILSLPLVASVTLLVPSVNLARPWQWPVQKYVSEAAAYLTFLIVLLMEITWDSKDDGGRSSSMLIPTFIIMFIGGMWYMNLRQLWKRGAHIYVRNYWNLYDITMLILFTCTFTCWLFSTGNLLLRRNPQTLPRYYWWEYDVRLLGEAIFAYSVLLAFARLLYYLQINNKTGPLQVSLTQLVQEVVGFLYMFVIILVSFAVGLWMLYHHYAGYQRNDGYETVLQSPAFNTLSMSLITLFWGIFGYSEPENVDIILPEIKVYLGNRTIMIYNRHRFTEMVGYTFYGLYHLVCVVLLLTMLVAIMTDTFSHIQSNEDVEWKFSRTKVWMRFYGDEITLPPPYNLIPNPRHVLIELRRLRDILFRREAHHQHQLIEKQLQRLKEDQESEDYEMLMHRLVRRYFERKQLQQR